MRGRWMRVLGVIAAMVIAAGPVAAEDFTGHEEDEQTLDCPAQGESVPANQEPPGEGECDEASETTYQGLVWDNDVKCGDDGQDLQIAKLYTTGDPAALKGGAGVCNDGSTVPIQGRVVLSGSQEQGGFTAYADGDKDNSNEQAQGFARLDAGTGGAAVRCGAADGKKDATNPGSADTQDNCG